MKPFRLCLLVLIVGAACQCRSVPSFAGTQPRDSTGDLTDLSLEELMDIPVYAASRYSQDVSEAPASVSIITSRDIKAYGYRTIADILNSVPGFYTSYDRSYHYAGVRGFSRPGDYNSRILLLINGVRTNENIYDSSGIGNDFNIDVDLIDRVEIVRGPGSALYGTNAFFAVINVITKTGPDLAGGELSASAGSRETYHGRLSFGRLLTEKGEFLVSGSYYDSDGADLYFPEFDSPETNHGIAAGRDGEHFGDLYSELRFGGWGLSISYMNRTKPRPTASYGTVFNNPRDKDLDGRFNSDVSYQRMLGKLCDMNVHLTFQDYRYDGDYTFDYANAGDPPDLAVNMDRIRGQWWGAEVKLCGEPLARNRVTAGAEFRDNFRIEQRNFDEGTNNMYVDSRQSTRVIGIYTQDEIRLAKRALFNAGVRYDHTSPLDQGDVSPRVALILTPLASTTLKLLYGEAFRSPNAFELYYQDGYNTIKDNPNLSSETIKTFELVIDQGLSDWLHGMLSVYRYDIHDLISQRIDPADSLLQYWNIDAAEANGAELTFIGKVPDAIEGHLSYSYINARSSTSDTRLSNSPQSLMKLNLLAPLMKQRVRVGIEAQYVGKRITLGGRTAAGYTVVNTTLATVNIFGSLEVSVSAHNVFNERYAYPAGGEFAQDALDADGRTFRFKCTYGF